MRPADHHALGGFGSFTRGVRLFVLTCAFATAAFAADEDKVIFPGSSAKSETAMAPKGGSLNTVTLVVGLALAGVGGWLVWRNRQGKPLGRDTRALAIEETRSLGNRQYLVVASYENKKFLLGVCPGQIQLLSPLTGAERSEAGK